MACHCPTVGTCESLKKQALCPIPIPDPATANVKSNLFSPFSALIIGNSKTPTTIYEDTISDGVSFLSDDECLAQHPLALTSNPIYHQSDQSTTIHSTQQYSQASPTQSSTNSFHTAIDSYQSYSIGQQFALEFGGMTTLNNLSVIEEACVTLLSPFP